MNKKRNILIVLAILVILGGRIMVKNFKAKQVDKNLNSSKKDLGIPIELATVSKSNLVEDISYIGTIESTKSAVVSPKLGGQIVNIYVEEGSMVEAGDLLAKIDDRQLRASYLTAEKKLESLRTNYNYLNGEMENFHTNNPLIKKLETLSSNYDYIKGESDKFKILYDEGAVPKATYEKIKQEEDTLYFQMEELKATRDDAYNKLSHERNMVEGQIDEVSSSINEMAIKIEDSLIKAPINGLVKKIYYDEGELAGMGGPFLEIDNNDELLVRVNISESDISRIKLGDKVILKLQALDNEISTRVSKIIPNLDPNTRIGIVEIGPIKTEEGLSLVSGNSAQVSIIINEARDKLTIPKNTIKSLSDESIVYLYEDGIVKERKITTGLTVGENTEVVEGLEEGDKIAANNLSKLYEGTRAYVFKGADQ